MSESNAFVSNTIETHLKNIWTTNKTLHNLYILIELPLCMTEMLRSYIDVI